MKRVHILASVAFCVASAVLVTPASAEWKPPTAEVPKENAAYIAKAKTAAPPAVANNATIVRTPPGRFDNGRPSRVERLYMLRRR